jgi:integrase/recombinase XerD
LDWSEDLHVTPHGFRVSIATILDERGVDHDSIKFLLGHSDNKDNLEYYIRRHKKKIQRLRHELTQIEKEIEEGVQVLKSGNPKTVNKDKFSSSEKVVKEKYEDTIEKKEDVTIKISQEVFLEIMKVNKVAGIALLEQNLVSFE